jgi:hypothetical protein
VGWIVASKARPLEFGFMATLDPRLLQLIETLVASRADWLVFELLNGIEAGIVVEESADDLAAARILARQEREASRPTERAAVSSESRPMEGNEQIIWAADYVGKRLKEALAMMDASAERLSMLVDRQGDAGARPQRSSVKLGLIDEDGMSSIGEEGRVAAQKAVFDLLNELERWAADVTVGRSAP